MVDSTGYETIGTQQGWTLQAALYGSQTCTRLLVADTTKEDGHRLAWTGHAGETLEVWTRTLAAIERLEAPSYLAWLACDQAARAARALQSLRAEVVRLREEIAALRAEHDPWDWVDTLHCDGWYLMECERVDGHHVQLFDPADELAAEEHGVTRLEALSRIATASEWCDDTGSALQGRLNARARAESERVATLLALAEQGVER